MCGAAAAPAQVRELLLGPGERLMAHSWEAGKRSGLHTFSEDGSREAGVEKSIVQRLWSSLKPANGPF